MVGSMTKAELLYLLSVVRNLGIRVWDYSDQVCDRLLSSVQRLLTTQPNLSLQAVAEDYITDCDCFDEMDPFQVLAVVMHMWTNMEIPFDCRSVVTVYEYLTLEQTCPSDAQFHQFRENTRRLRTDPEEYYETERVNVPTPNIAHLPITRCTNSDGQCGICLQDIVKGTAIYCLPPCLHVYHAEKGECLGDASVKNWLEKSTQCPMCKGDVCIDLKRPAPEVNQTTKRPRFHL
jgi:hypothetical protein